MTLNDALGLAEKALQAEGIDPHSLGKPEATFVVPDEELLSLAIEPNDYYPKWLIRYRYLLPSGAESIEPGFFFVEVYPHSRKVIICDSL